MASVPLAAWLAGGLGALLVMGPALGPGSLLNLDLVVASEPPVPSGVWGLGPELPRRVPLWVPLAWLSSLAGGELVGRLLLVVLLTLAFAGAWRLTVLLAAERVGAAGPWLAGALYAFGPFLTTRAAVGHVHVLWVGALLPWGALALLAPVRRRYPAVLWAAALGLAGVFGGLVAGALVVAGLVRERQVWMRRPGAALRSLALLVATQLPWLVPLVVVASGSDGADLATARDFAPSLASPADAARLAVGQGFWNGSFQIGSDLPWISVAAAVVVLVAAINGWRLLRRDDRGPLGAVALVGLVLAVLPALPLLDGVADRISVSPLGAPLRDSHKALVPFLLVVAVAAGVGAGRALDQWLARARTGAVASAVVALPVAAVVVLVLPSAWGFGGQLRPVHLPEEWAAARALVRAEPGTVLALPWYQYFSTSVAEGRVTLDVVPYYFGGDVLAASDPRTSAEPRREVPDPRADATEQVLARAREGEPVSEALARLGVRWVVVQHDVDWSDYTGLVDDPGLRREVAGETLDLYRVDGWRGDVVAGTEVVEADAVVSPVWSVDGSGDAVVARPAQDGWLRGWSGAGRTAEGLLALPAGSGLVWFWPTLLVLVADAVALVTVAASARLVVKGRPIASGGRNSCSEG